MTDIKQRLRDFHLHTCNEAADHVAAQEKRIAEVEAHILQKAQSDKLDRLCDANPAIAAIRDEVLSDAIDAERYRDIRDVFAAGHVQQNMFFEIMRTICSVKNKTPELFDSAMDAAIDAMKAAK